MRNSQLRLLAASLIALASDLVVVEAQFQEPVANLPLTCLDEAAIGQPQNNCTGPWRYQLPVSDQIVILRSSGTWARAASLAGTDTLTVCALPVRPNEYSGCKDASGVRRLIQLPKSQVFSSSPSPTPAGRVLDLSQVPVVLTDPGLYVLDRSWNVVSPTPDGAIIVGNSNVTLDLRGFDLTVYESGVSANSNRENFTIRNGRITSHRGIAIQVEGPGSLIEHVTASALDYGTTISVSGKGSVLANSTVSLINGSLGNSAVSAREGAIVRDNQITSDGVGVFAAYRTSVVDNDVYCEEACVVVERSDSIVSRNKIHGFGGYAVELRGDYNNVKDNVLQMICIGANSIPWGGNSAIFVEGRANTIVGNLAPAMSCGGASGWGSGIFFTQNGNFYGHNVMFAAEPFFLGGTTQTDLGGNAGIRQ